MKAVRRDLRSEGQYRSALAPRHTPDIQNSVTDVAVTIKRQQSLRSWFCKSAFLLFVTLFLFNVPIVVSQSQQSGIPSGPRLEAENKFK